MSENFEFGTVGIVGVGLLGGSIGKALQLDSRVRRIIGVGRSEERLDEAIKLGAITESTTEFESVASECDLIFICTPVAQIAESLPHILTLAKPDCTVTDVGSVKNAICNAAGDDPRFVGAHPMAGSEQSGARSSRADLFNEATWAITPLEHTGKEHFIKVRTVAQKLGASTIIMSPDAHDRAVAVTSHLPHAIATSLMRLASLRSQSAPEIMQLTAGSFADTTRVAASSPELWTEIFVQNRHAIIESLLSYRTEIDGFIDDLDSGSTEKLKERFASGSDAKRSWSQQ